MTDALPASVEDSRWNDEDGEAKTHQPEKATATENGSEAPAPAADESAGVKRASDERPRDELPKRDRRDDDRGGPPRDRRYDDRHDDRDSPRFGPRDGYRGDDRGDSRERYGSRLG